MIWIVGPWTIEADSPPMALMRPSSGDMWAGAVALWCGWTTITEMESLKD